jgi:hypothetical protein
MSQLQVNRINDASGGVLAPISSVMRNRIINGAMVIDQRNAGASITAAISPTYTVDRFYYAFTQSGKVNLQQNLGSVTPPNGYKNYFGFNTASVYTPLAGDNFVFVQSIEGYNIADLGWGTANAKTVTLSFWVRSSLTGTWGGSIYNNGGIRSYPFSYTINSANTWEQKSITIAGDTSGTWESTNGQGINLVFSIGTGSTFKGAPGAWGSTLYTAPTGQTNLLGTSGATWYVTGVQLEVGTQATSFEYRQYQQELALCQRYCEIVTTPGGFSPLFFGQAINASDLQAIHNYTVQKRASATLIFSGLANTVLLSATGGGTTSPTGASMSTGTQRTRVTFTGGSGLVAGNACQLADNNSTAPLFIFSAEL